MMKKKEKREKEMEMKMKKTNACSVTPLAPWYQNNITIIRR
jgi:hypothetical protein